MEFKRIQDKVLYLLRIASSGKCTDADYSTIKTLSKEYSDNMIVGRVFGYSVSDYALATLKWLGDERSTKLFYDLSKDLPDHRRNGLNDLINSNAYLQL